MQGHEQQNGESGNENPTVGVGEEDPVDEEDKDPEPEEGNNSKEEGQDPQPEEEKNDSTEHQGGGNLR